jgi:hypothetical protein
MTPIYIILPQLSLFLLVLKRISYVQVLRVLQQCNWGPILGWSKVDTANATGLPRSTLRIIRQKSEKIMLLKCIKNGG